MFRTGNTVLYRVTPHKKRLHCLLRKNDMTTTCAVTNVGLGVGLAITLMVTLAMIIIFSLYSASLRRTDVIQHLGQQLTPGVLQRLSERIKEDILVADLLIAIAERRVVLVPAKPSTDGLTAAEQKAISVQLRPSHRSRRRENTDTTNESETLLSSSSSPQ